MYNKIHLCMVYIDEQVIQSTDVRELMREDGQEASTSGTCNPKSAVGSVPSAVASTSKGRSFSSETL